MCDQNLLGILIMAAEAAITIAAIMLAIAIQQGNSIFTAFQSLGTSVTTASFITAATVSLGIAIAVAGGCKTGACGAQGGAVQAALIGTTVALAAVAALVWICAFCVVCVPITGPLALIALLGVSGGFAYLGAMLVMLATCFMTIGALSAWLALAMGFAFMTAGVVAIVAIYGIVVTIQTVIEEASG
jgi:hypothetical protein